jgi:polyprenyldihydroxybenzoate methyltransferase / 3-demethylubiquinol 3-O-methyltransferase
VNAKEAKKFADLASHWWDLQGPLRPLHQLNPTRCSFIKTSLCDNYGLDPTSATPLTGLKLLDVGCGGGILSEALARMGADVHGIDVNSEGIAAAQAHAALDPTIEPGTRLKYSTTKAEDIVLIEKESFDAVIASEVIEHVASVPAFCTALIQATAPGGAILISTLNRTVRAYALAVVAAEHVLRWAPPGTHEWSKFISPEELVLAMEEAGEREGKSVTLEQVSGMMFDPLKGQWGLGRDVGINYIAFFRKAAG